MDILSLGKKLISILPWFKQKSVKPGLCGIIIQADGIGIAYVLRAAEQLPTLQWCEWLPLQPTDNVTDVLTTVVTRHDISGANCCLILPTNDYKLVVSDALPVPAEELIEALRWQIKDLIDFPIAEAALDCYPLPSPSSANKNQQLQVVVTRLAKLQALNEQISASGLYLTIIDTTELALRNVTALFPEEKQGVGIIWAKPGSCSLLISQQNMVYFTRNFTINVDEILTLSAEQALSEKHNNLLEELALQIQRSLDYYQSQLRQAPPAKLFITDPHSAVLEFLSSRLTSKLENLDLSTVLNCPSNPDALSLNKCLAAVGGALRME